MIASIVYYYDLAMRLSRSAWNNVIIFSVMGFILLINLTQSNNQDEPTAQDSNKLVSVIGQGNTIVTLMVDQHTAVERVGRGWQITQNKLGKQALEQMMRSWHQAQGQLSELSLDRSQHQAVLVSMSFADQAAIAMFSVYVINQQMIIFSHQANQYFALPEPMLKQLLPSALFAN